MITPFVFDTLTQKNHPQQFLFSFSEVFPIKQRYVQFNMWEECSSNQTRWQVFQQTTFKGKFQYSPIIQSFSCSSICLGISTWHSQTHILKWHNSSPYTSTFLPIQQCQQKDWEKAFKIIQIFFGIVSKTKLQEEQSVFVFVLIVFFVIVIPFVFIVIGRYFQNYLGDDEG